jgi:3'(2'), 5'-bisphosphate nucleotidase
MAAIAPTGGPYAAEIAVARQAALAAAEVIRQHYAAGGIAVDTKADASPVTQADHDANNVIVDRLRVAFPADGILSEESPDDAKRLTKRRVWIIDPLDGTRDFVARTGEFCVHVALAIDDVAVVGVVAQPVEHALYWAATGAGAFVERDGQIQRLTVSSQAELAVLRIGVSRLNLSSRVGECLRAAGLDGQAVAMGASVKYLAVAAGTLDGTINLSPGECEWDTCAPEVIVREAGGRVTDGQGRPFLYNQLSPAHRHGSIVSNGASHDQLVRLVSPYAETL